MGKIGVQLLAISGLSLLLGFAFNSSNPVGVKIIQSSPALTTAAPPRLLSVPELPQVAAPAETLPEPSIARAAEPVPAQAEPHAEQQNPRSATWVEIKPLLESGECLLVDVRPKGAYEAGHIPGAISFPEASTPEEYEEFRNKYGPAAPIIFYCASTSCSVSQRMASKFVQEFGYQNVRHFTGGYLEYQREELAKGVAAPQQ